MYLAWSMTYFHINLDPRGKKKMFCRQFLYPCGYIGFFFFRSFWVDFFFFSGRAFKDTSSGRNVEDHSAIRGPRAPPLGVGFRLRRPAKSPLKGGLLSSSACTVTCVCSVSTPVLFQNTSVERVSSCAQERTTWNVVPACLPAPSVPLLSCLRHVLTER